MGVFFDTWELWEKFTFALACAIVTVFIAGLIKVQIANRRTREYEVRDEEKRIRKQEMRQTGKDLRKQNKKHAGPEPLFGVKALEQGTEVEGIYVERNSLKAALSSSNSSGNFSDVSTAYTGYDAENGTKSSHTSPIATPNQLRASHGSDVTLTKAYKPRRASGLRFSEATQYNEDALSALEGRPISPASHIPLGHHSLAEQLVHSARPGELSSLSNSLMSSKDQNHFRDSASHASSPQHPISPPPRTRAKPPLAYETRGMVYSPRRNSVRSSRQFNYTPVSQQTSQAYSRPTSSSGSTPHSSPQGSSQTNDYFALATHDAESGTPATPFDPFSTPQSSAETEPPGPYFVDTGEKSYNVVSTKQVEATLYDSSETMEQFGAGNIHMNRKSRCSNSTFQILPAGTFGTPVALEARENTEERVERKESLLKRTSKRLSRMSRISGRRGSNMSNISGGGGGSAV